MIERILHSRGLGIETAAAKASMYHRACSALLSLGAGEPVTTFFVPGRIEVLGKHTDYAGGSSLLAATERGFCVVAAKRADSSLRLIDAAAGEQIQFPATPDLPLSPGHWSHYPKTVTRRLSTNFPGQVQGADIAFLSDLPPAAGMSSSSALVVATFLVLSEINSLPQSEVYRANIKSLEDLAGYLGTIENGQSFGSLEGHSGVGTFGGSEDHTAILCCQAGMLSQYSYYPVRLQRQIPMTPGYVLAVATSGVSAEKTGAAMEKYNRVSRLVSEIVRLWQEATGHPDKNLQGILSRSPEAKSELTEILRKGPDPDSLLRRLDHYLAENGEILPAAADALARGDIEAFGRWVDRSQSLSESLLQNLIPQTVFLAREARALGAAAASAFGAGFGGSVYALIRTEDAPEFLRRWTGAYAGAFPADAEASEAWITSPGPAAFSLPADHPDTDHHGNTRRSIAATKTKSPTPG